MAHCNNYMGVSINHTGSEISAIALDISKRLEILNSIIVNIIKDKEVK
jgi:hypothetical protein